MDRETLLLNFYAGLSILFKQLAKGKLTDTELSEVVHHLESAIDKIKKGRKT